MEDNKALKVISNIMMKIAIFFVKVAIWFVVVYFVGMKLFDLGERLFVEKSMSKDDKQVVEFTIKEGDNDEIIANELKNMGLIDDILAFRFRAKIYKTNFNPNTYNLDKTMTIKNMLDIFDDQDEKYIVSKSKDEENLDVYQLSPEDQENIEGNENIEE